MRNFTKILSAFLVPCLLAQGGAAALAANGAGTQNLPFTGYYRLVNKATGLSLTETTDNTYAPPYDTRRLALEAETQTNRQVWSFTDRGDGSAAIKAYTTGFCLHLTNEWDSSLPDSNYVINISDDGTAPNSWTIVDAGNGYYRLESVLRPTQYLASTGQAMPAEPGGSVVSAMTAAEGDTSQQWQLVPVAEPFIPDPPDIAPIYPLDPLSPVQMADPCVQQEVSAGKVQLTGYMNDAIVQMQENQLKTTDWKNLVDQFRNHTDTTGAWRGEFWGKLMRGACIDYEYTQDEALYHQLDQTVRDLLTTQESSGQITTYPAGSEFTGWDIWARKYVMLGLESFYKIARDDTLKAEIMKALCIHADYILSRVGPASEGKIPINDSCGDWQGLPASSILDPMILLYQMTGYQRYLDFSTYIVNEGGAKAANVFELAYENDLSPYQYMPGWDKAYEMSSCFEGLAEYASITGSAKWKTAVVNYCKKVAQQEITIVGGGGGDGPTYNVRGVAGEQWNDMADEQTNPDIQHMQETCVTVTWLRLCEKIVCMTGDPAFVDEIEKTMYNVLLGAFRPESVPSVAGTATEWAWDYFSPLNGTRNNNGGGDQPGLNSCCPANGPSALALIPFIEVMNSASGPVVNLYDPGTVKAAAPSGKDVGLKIDTQYPKTGDIKITVTPAQAEQFNLRLRIPAWSTATTVSVNGQAVSRIQPGAYLSLDRLWQTGDVISIAFDMRTRVLESPQGQKSNAGDYEALLRGPIVLARDARFGESSVFQGVKILKDAQGYADVTPSNTDLFQNHMEFSVKTQDGGSFHVTDYASAGSTWDANSQYATWLPTSVNEAPKAGWDYTVTCEGNGSNASVDATGNVIEEPSQTGGPQLRQMWMFEASGSSYRIKSAANGLYLTVDPAAVQNDGGNILTSAASDSSCQLWNLVLESNGYCTIVNAASGRCFSEAGGDSNNIHQWTNIKSPLQFWKLQAAAVNITAVEAPGSVSVPFGTPSNQIGLPGSVSVSLSDGTKREISVTWNIGAYNGSRASTYAATASLSLPGDVVNPNALSASVSVTVEADKSQLFSAVSSAENLLEQNYTAASWAGFKAALDAAKTVLADSAATQENADSAVKTLKDALNALVIEPADKSALQSTVNAAASLAESDYTAASWADFQAALDAAKTVLADSTATQANADSAVKTLKDAQNALVIAPADKSALQSTVNAAASLVESDYTAASWAGFKAALDAAKAVLADDNAAQSAIDTAQATLQSATGKLVKQTASFGPSSVGIPSGSQSATPSAAGSSGPAPNNSSPETGGRAPVVSLLFFSAVSLCAALCLRGKKNDRNV